MIEINSILATFVVSLLVFTTGGAWWWARDEAAVQHRAPDPFFAALVFLGGLTAVGALGCGFLVGVGIVK